MKAKIIMAFILCMTLCVSPVRAEGEGGILTGVTRLACEAILCLSSGVRPGECSPSLTHYFGITRKKWSDTLDARMDFLSLCPSSSEPGMPGLLNAIVNGAGRCDAALLNRVLKKSYSYEDCNDNYWDIGNRCRTVTVSYIDDRLPGYCQAYTSHEWSYKLGVRYQGEKMKGGRWVDE